MIIKIDTREQQPYTFKDSETGTLSVGDYSILGLEDCISIERKTLDDLISCLTSDRDRFERELYRGKSLDYFCLIIEASLQDIVNGNYRSQASPKSMIQSLLAFSIRYRLPVWFCESRIWPACDWISVIEVARGVQKRFEAIGQPIPCRSEIV